MLIFKRKTRSFQPPISDDAMSSHTISHTTFASLCVQSIIYTHTHTRENDYFTMLTQNIRLKLMLKMVGEMKKGRETHTTHTTTEQQQQTD